MFKVMITRVADGRQWVEWRQSEDAMVMLADSVYENHPTGYVVMAQEEPEPSGESLDAWIISQLGDEPDDQGDDQGDDSGGE